MLICFGPTPGDSERGGRARVILLHGSERPPTSRPERVPSANSAPGCEPCGLAADLGAGKYPDGQAEPDPAGRHGLDNSHLHVFSIGDKRIGMCFDDYPEGEIDEKDMTVLQALREERRFVFEYDFGDSWEHDVVIEDLTWSYYGLKFAVCLDGENACPPDDVGGTYGYTEFLEAVTDPEPRSTTGWSNGPTGPSTRPNSTWPTPMP